MKMDVALAHPEQTCIVARYLSNILEDILVKDMRFHLCQLIWRTVARKMKQKETEKENLPVQKVVKVK